MIAQIDSSTLKDVAPEAWKQRKEQRDQLFNKEEAVRVSYLSYLRYETSRLSGGLTFKRPEVMRKVKQIIGINLSGGKLRAEGA